MTALARWAEQQLDTQPDRPLLATALPEFETALIRTALLRARGRRQEAARLLGWGRNTLARKIKELRIEV
jgi:two-component system nitrogen regulation response regulator GlnG